MAPSHPSQSELDSYLAGRLEGPRGEEVLAHLETCRDCAETVATITRDSRSKPTDTTVIESIGPFVVTGFLGKGGMGAVYKAKDVMLHREVAIKVILSGEHADVLDREKFLAEARAAAGVEHPNIVTVYQVGMAGDSPYIVMPLLKGENLADRLRREKKLPPVEVQRILRETAAGLKAAHDKGIVHRDIKPANLWIEQSGNVRILDFGLARAIEGLAQHDDVTMTGGKIAGSPPYMSPEQVRGQIVDRRSDLWGLGCIAYECLAGHRPFTGNMFDVMEKILDKDPPPLDAPKPLKALVSKLLQKDRNLRPADAGELIGPIEPEGKAATIRSRLPWAVAGFLLFVAGVAYATLSGRGAVDKATSGNNAAKEHPVSDEPLRIVALDVHRYRKIADGKGESCGILGKQTWDAFVGDQVMVEAKLTKPAYSYLAAFRPDGEMEMVYPDSEKTAPPLSDRPRYPSLAKMDDEKYGLAEGSGLWVFAVISSEKPLPPFEEWMAERGPQAKGAKKMLGKFDLARLPWKKHAGAQGKVLLFNGQFVEPMLQPGVVRAKGERAFAVEESVQELGRWLQPPGTVTQAVGFSVEERKSP